MEARVGFEPTNRGFADLSLSHLGTAPRKGKMERAMGLEPTTSCLASRCSTAELRPLIRHQVRIPEVDYQIQVFLSTSAGVKNQRLKRLSGRDTTQSSKVIASLLEIIFTVAVRVPTSRTTQLANAAKRASFPDFRQASS